MKLLRSLLFYMGYLLAIVVAAFTLVPVAACLPLRHRFRVLNQYNRFIIFWFGLCCGVRYRIEGLGNLPDRPCVVLSNHQSEWETLYLQLLKPPMCTVFKKELLNIPIFGWSLRLIWPIPLDRTNPSSAVRKVLTEGAERLKAGMSVLIFPEGTRVPPGHRRPFKKSGIHVACRVGAPIVPVAHNAGERWPGRRLVKSPGQLTMVVGPVIETEGRRPNEVLAEVERFVETELARISEVPRPAGPDEPEAKVAG
ncbi:lysophospholipid acyltransferase family protein [Kushneria phosphatilytica]|uniref:1-acyl-sn-glycerol-3-phosphate acyltransferase n=1 Tax=Kushneria phosphatilytica TaxID=657387 RepID=A0A1S1NWJ3_9GAMM|nr:lysophospholipid acyltransferase family protein [Kushneria phosphatilytica]OHV11513.1 1-acyl-sn-glycerol-3-phosphate acyltransferase [Kushneria phosphatilytica]QEL12114.1 1-acyl-sn-glycerol-3-phosphate acyltransferase [Kushneria phosphatilytica]